MTDQDTNNTPKKAEAEYVKPPSFLKMAMNFSKDLATYIKNGAPNVSTEDYIARLDTCQGCEFLIEEKKRCGVCGCAIEHKAKWRTAGCPKQKWAVQDVSDLDIRKVEQNEDDRRTKNEQTGE
jgi:hypothetical protein